MMDAFEARSSDRSMLLTSNVGPLFGERWIIQFPHIGTYLVLNDRYLFTVYHANTITYL